MTQTKPHTLVGTITPFGEVSLGIECPYQFGEPRPCVLGEPLPMGQHCDWADFEAEKHHESCPAATDRSADCPWDADGGETCWPGEPEECDGFNWEGEHMHPVQGCYAEHLVNEVGWQDAIIFEKDERTLGKPYREVREMHLESRRLTLPLEVHISPDGDEGTVYVVPWAQARESKEQTA